MHHHAVRQLAIVLLAVATNIRPIVAAESPTIREVLVIESVGSSGRTPIQTDAIQALIVAGRWNAPHEGDTVVLPDGKSKTWQAMSVGENGLIKSPALAGGYAYVGVSSDADRVVMLEASGHGMVYVNGEPRMGDPYSAGYVHLPVKLRAGQNELLFKAARGDIRVRLGEPAGAVFIDPADATLPDVVEGEDGAALGAMVVVNATETWTDALSVRAVCGGGAPRLTAVAPLPPLSTRKIGFEFLPRRAEADRLTVQLVGASVPSEPVTVDLRFRHRTDTRKLTFTSGVDGSVQYYALRPGVLAGGSAAGPGAGLALSLHGASVEAIGQADAYSSKPWCHIVCPTNRRPYGFDWEDWGRMDAIEVLDLAQRELKTDPSRTYLTGHSMGGHGTCIVGAMFPDRFAAIAPSAGWPTFWSYAAGPRPEPKSDVAAMLRRAANVSDTLALERNYLWEGISVLHGDADDNVPVAQARQMVERLKTFHHDFDYHEQPGAGHWWDASDEPGADCVDWPAFFDLFARRRLPADDQVRSVEFVTVNPEISARCHWLTIGAQTRGLEPSTAAIRLDPGRRRFSGTTGNVARLALSAGALPPGAPVRIELDGGKLADIAWPGGGYLWLERRGEVWGVIGEPAATLKSPARSGPFKQAFRSQVMFVVGTRGTAEENAWALAKARLDAETLWYRGNGSIDVVLDKDFNPGREPDRCVILYGNAQTNAAWEPLLASSPVQVSGARIRIGETAVEGAGLACLLVRPRPGSGTALVGVVGGTGITGMRLTDRLPYFVSGVAYPDCTVLGPDVLSQGVDAVEAAGFFGPDWSVETGEFAWRGEKP
jgi:dienelactone hydrolase